MSKLPSSVTSDAPRVKSKGGRPSIYRPEMIAKGYEYLKEKEEYVENYVKSDNQSHKMFQRVVHPNLPYAEELCERLGISVPVMHEWKNDPRKPEFAELLWKLKELQRRRLMEGGLRGDFNPQIVKLLLGSWFGIREMSDVTSGGEPIKGNTIILQDFNTDVDATDS
jgi:hypothetical protein